MNRFMQMGNSDKCQAGTLAVSALGVIIASAQDIIGPHLNDCINMLQTLLPTTPSKGNKKKFLTINFAVQKIWFCMKMEVLKLLKLSKTLV